MTIKISPSLYGNVVLFVGKSCLRFCVPTSLFHCNLPLFPQWYLTYSHPLTQLNIRCKSLNKELHQHLSTALNQQYFIQDGFK